MLGRPFFSAGAFIVTAKICAGTIYFAIQYIVSIALHSDGSDRHRHQYQQKTWLITLISVIALLCNLALCRLLIPQLGAKGAAMATADIFWLYFVLKTEHPMRLWQKLPRLSIYGITLACLLFCLAYTYWGSRDNYMLLPLHGWCCFFLLIVHHKPQLQQLAALLKGRLKTH